MVEFSDLPEESRKTFFLSFYLIQKNDFNFFDDHIPFFKKYWLFFMRMFLIIIQLTAMAIYVVGHIQSDLKIVELCHLLSCYIAIIQACVKFGFVLHHKAKIQKLIIHLGVIWRMDDLTDFQIGRKNLYLKILSVSQLVFYWCGVIGIWLTMLIPLCITLVRKFILQQNTELILPFGSVYIIFDTSKNWFFYIIAFAFQIYTVKGLGYMYFGIEFLIFTLCTQLSISFSLLREDLNVINPRSNRAELNQSVHYNPKNTIETIIKQHQDLIDVTKLMNNIFNKIFFINLLFATFVACFYTFACIVAETSTDLVKNVISILALTPLSFVLCFYSELLRTESDGIAGAAYESLWYNGDVRYQKKITFIIARAQRPCSLLSLNYSPITLNSFTKVMSTTWSYLSLAMTMYSGSN